MKKSSGQLNVLFCPNTCILSTSIETILLELDLNIRCYPFSCKNSCDVLFQTVIGQRIDAESVIQFE
jgi:hypothetical protein